MERIKISITAENVIENAVICLAPAGTYPADVTRQFLDMELYIRVVLPPDLVPNGSRASFAIRTMDQADCFGGIDALFETATRNVRERCKTMDMDKTFGLSEEPQGRIIICTTDPGDYGAGVFAVPGFVKKVCADQKTEKCYVLPSSIHEVLIVPATDDELSLSRLSDLVAEVNRAQVDEWERLTDHAYLYNAVTDEFSF